MMKVQVTILNDLATLPTRGSLDAAGYDLYAAIEGEIVIPPSTSVKVPTGLAMAIPAGYFGGLYARSGLACKEGLRPANCVGVIDSDYRGEVIVCLTNDSQEVRVITPRQRIAQLIIQPYLDYDWEVTNTLDDTARGNGGFGSSGK